VLFLECKWLEKQAVMSATKSSQYKKLKRFIRLSIEPGKNTVLETALVLRRLGTDFIRALG
jgi:hypothetical protein